MKYDPIGFTVLQRENPVSKILRKRQLVYVQTSENLDEHAW